MTRVLVMVLLMLAGGAAADQKPVTVGAKELVLAQPIYFETGKAVIQSQSFELLDQVAVTINSDKRLGLIEIQVHTDSRGSNSWNLKLSDERAHAVYDYLVGKGVDTKKLRAKGYGETKPLDKGNNEAAWAKNRRTTFVILQRKTT